MRIDSCSPYDRRSNKKPLNVAMSPEELERERALGLALRASIQKVLNNNKLRRDSLGSCTLDVKDCGDGLEARVVAGLQTFFTRYMQYVGTIVKADAHIVSKKLRLAGTVDVLAKAQDGSFTLVNWKREDKVRDSHPLLPPPRQSTNGFKTTSTSKLKLQRWSRRRFRQRPDWFTSQCPLQHSI
jgi:hypothetical protein